MAFIAGAGVAYLRAELTLVVRAKSDHVPTSVALLSAIQSFQPFRAPLKKPIADQWGPSVRASDMSSSLDCSFFG